MVAMTTSFRYLVPVSRLTKQEQWVLCIVLGLLLTGWAVKTYRTAHPHAGTEQREGPGTAVTRVAAP
jgi:hypothetical protein